ncbi:MAG: methionyl-tRNA formyltransferase [Candidatus Aminicenantales bacterium]
MRIIFFGSPASALPSLEKILGDGHGVECVFTQPDRPAGRGRKLTPPPVKQFALERNIPVVQPEKIRKDQDALSKIGEIRPELIVVVAYGQILPASIIYLPKHGAINVHFSLLPKYRGASPVQRAILNGETTTGVTIFRMNEKMDEGDILSKTPVPIHPNEYAYELEARLAAVGAELLSETIEMIDRLTPEKQDHALATYAPRLSKEDGKIDWQGGADRVDRLVRACTPWPSAYTFLKGKRVKILGGKVISAPIPPSRAGNIVAVAPEGITVSCGRGAYLVEKIQPEGRKPMEAHAFALGARIFPGDRFTDEETANRL